VWLSGDTTRVKLVLEERGVRPFDPTNIPARDIDKPASERRPGGLGVHLVRTLMDDFRYRHHDGVTTITVSRKLGARRA
jgi:serine/threonine-protein kinase RsbW